VGAEMHPLNGPGYCFMNILPIFSMLFFWKISKNGSSTCISAGCALVHLAVSKWRLRLVVKLSKCILVLHRMMYPFFEYYFSVGKLIQVKCFFWCSLLVIKLAMPRVGGRAFMAEWCL
jgi:hypothetical protein